MVRPLRCNDGGIDSENLCRSRSIGRVDRRSPMQETEPGAFPKPAPHPACQRIRARLARIGWRAHRLCDPLPERLAQREEPRQVPLRYHLWEESGRRHHLPGNRGHGNGGHPPWVVALATSLVHEDGKRFLYDLAKKVARASRREVISGRLVPGIFLIVNARNISPQECLAEWTTCGGKHVYREAIVEEINPRSREYYRAGDSIPARRTNRTRISRRSRTNGDPLRSSRSNLTDHDAIKGLGSWQFH